MTYAQIYAESLKLMFATLTDDIAPTAEGMGKLLTDPNYRDYLIIMPGAVNRCFADLEAKKVLPWRTVKPNMDTADDVSGGYKRLLLSEMIPDCYEVERVICHRGYGERIDLVMHEDCFLEGDELILPAGEEYVIHYTPTLPRIDDGTDLDTTVPLPRTLAEVIPYYVKGELYRLEEPHEAAEAHNLYEERVAQVYPPAGQRQDSVAMVYGF